MTGPQSHSEPCYEDNNWSTFAWDRPADQPSHSGSCYLYVTVLYHYCVTNEWLSFHLITFNLSRENWNPHPIYIKRLVSRLCTSVPQFFINILFVQIYAPFSYSQIFVSGLITNWIEMNSAETAIFCPNLLSLYICLNIDGKSVQDLSHGVLLCVSVVAWVA
jgi:hypothetical protein